MWAKNPFAQGFDDNHEGHMEDKTKQQRSRTERSTVKQGGPPGLATTPEPAAPDSLGGGMRHLLVVLACVN